MRAAVKGPIQIYKIEATGKLGLTLKNYRFGLYIDAKIFGAKIKGNFVVEFRNPFSLVKQIFDRVVDACMFFEF